MSIMRSDQFPLKDWRLINVSLIQFPIVSIICICLNLWNPQWLLFLNILFHRTLSSTPSSPRQQNIGWLLRDGVTRGPWWFWAMKNWKDSLSGEIWINVILKLQYFLKALTIPALPNCLKIWIIKNVCKIKSGTLIWRTFFCNTCSMAFFQPRWFSGAVENSWSVCS